MKPAMKPGGHMDATVARKVMGLSNVRRAHGTASIYLYDREPDDPREVPRYSTDIAAAWAVVGKLTGDGSAVEVTSYRSDIKAMPGDGPGVLASVLRNGPEYRTVQFREWGDTAPEAICRAALASVRPAS